MKRRLTFAATVCGLGSILSWSLAAGGAPAFDQVVGAEAGAALRSGSACPTVIAAALGALLAIMAAYALSAAAVLPQLPGLRPVLAAMSALLLGVGVIALPGLLAGSASGAAAAFALIGTGLLLALGVRSSPHRGEDTHR